MKQRTITAIIALCLFIPIVLAGGLWMDWLTVLFAAVGISEIFLMKKQILVSFNFLLALLATLTWTVLSKNKTTFDDVGVYILAALYIGIGFHYMAAIRAYPQNGLALLGCVFVVVWSTDIGAYMIGRKIGKHKLWPVISPNKTWEGSIGAVVCALICSAIYMAILGSLGINFGVSELTMIILAFFLSIVGQMGDLVESAYKRFYGVKDSGKILPGHGGILDRFDSMLFVLPVVATILGIVH